MAKLNHYLLTVLRAEHVLLTLLQELTFVTNIFKNPLQHELHQTSMIAPKTLTQRPQLPLHWEQMLTLYINIHVKYTFSKEKGEMSVLVHFYSSQVKRTALAKTHPEKEH